MAGLAELRRRFAKADFLRFEEQGGLVRAHVTTAHATATIYLQGAHLTAWQPAGQQAVIFVSRRSEYAPGKPIRGGIPIAFPWFANDSRKDRVDGHPGPAHGFARVQEWTLQSAARTGEDVVLTLELGPTEMSRSMGFDHFGLSISFRIGQTLTAALTVSNADTKTLVFEEALHTYYQVTDIHEVAVEGLESKSYIDKTDEFKVKPASGAPIRFTGMVDRVYENTTAACVIHDGTVGRRIVVEKAGSDTTVVWNPWKEMPDLGPWEWHEMVAVETVNAASNTISLAPGASHTMQLMVKVEKA